MALWPSQPSLALTPLLMAYPCLWPRTPLQPTLGPPPAPARPGDASLISQPGLGPASPPWALLRAWTWADPSRHLGACPTSSVQWGCAQWGPSAPGSPLVWGELLYGDVSPKTSAEGTEIVRTSSSEAFHVRQSASCIQQTACLNIRYHLPFTLHCSLFPFLDTLNLYHIDDSPKYGIIYIIYIYIITVWQRWVSPLFWWNCFFLIETVLSDFLDSLSAFPWRPKAF